MTETITIKEAIILLLIGLILTGLKELIKNGLNFIEIIFCGLYIFFLLTFIILFKDSISRLWAYNSLKEKTAQKRLILLFIWIFGSIIAIIFVINQLG